jgi:hypothetical protein
MYTRKLIDFLNPRTPQQTEQAEPLPNAGTAVDAEFDWPPSAKDLEAYGVVRVCANDGSEIDPSSSTSPDPSSARACSQPSQRC